jgi:hypothetical protein
MDVQFSGTFSFITLGSVGDERLDHGFRAWGRRTFHISYPWVHQLNPSTSAIRATVSPQNIDSTGNIDKCIILPLFPLNYQFSCKELAQKLLSTVTSEVHFLNFLFQYHWE